MVQYCKYSRYNLNRKFKTYLFSSRNVLIMDETVKRLRLGWTIIVRPWCMTWSTKVALMSSEIMVIAWPLRPRPPLFLCLPHPLPLALSASMLANFSKWLTVFLYCFDAAVHIFKNTQAETVALMVKMTHFVCKRL